jgi:hypothetical protein
VVTQVHLGRVLSSAVRTLAGRPQRIRGVRPPRANDNVVVAQTHAHQSASIFGSDRDSGSPEHTARDPDPDSLNSIAGITAAIPARIDRLAVTGAVRDAAAELTIAGPARVLA